MCVLHTAVHRKIKRHQNVCNSNVKKITLNRASELSVFIHLLSIDFDCAVLISSDPRRVLGLLLLTFASQFCSAESVFNFEGGRKGIDF
jgi:hypothetical protein